MAIGKAATGQVLWPAALALVVGTVPGAQFGGSVSKKVNTNRNCRRYRAENVVAGLDPIIY